MKILLSVFILIFCLQSLTKANDISDFEIEGMSLYESALNFFSQSKIKNNEEDYYNKKTFKTATIKSKNFEVYQDVQISYKTNDKKYVLYDISGIVDKKYDFGVSVFVCWAGTHTNTEPSDSMAPFRRL